MATTLAEVSSTSIPVERSLADFRVNRKDFLAELELAKSVQEGKTTLPILANVMFEVSGSTVTIAGTDLDQTIATSCAAQVAKPGRLTIPGRKLLDYVKLLEGETITFTALDNDWVSIKCNRSKTKMVGMNPRSFPQVPLFPAQAEAKIPIHTLRALLTRVAFAVSGEESRYTLNAINMELNPEDVTLVSTDGHRLALARSREKVAGVTSPKKYLLAYKGIKNLQSLLSKTSEETVDFACVENSLFFRVGHRTYSIRLITGQFPNYSAVIPAAQTLTKKVIVGVKDMGDTVKRVMQFADERSSAIKMSLSAGELRISSSSTESGESEETLPVTYEAEPLSFGFNGSYMLDVAQVLAGGEMKLEFSSGQAAVKIGPESSENAIEFVSLLMPMRV